MKRCPYAAELVDWHSMPTRLLVYCRRRNIFGSSGWHLHDAPVPPILCAHQGIRIRWRSTSVPDFHEDYPRGPAHHYGGLDGEEN